MQALRRQRLQQRKSLTTKTNKVLKSNFCLCMSNHCLFFFGAPFDWNTNTEKNIHLRLMLRLCELQLFAELGRCGTDLGDGTIRA